MADNNNYLRTTPQSDLDYQYMIVNPVWGNEESINQLSDNKLKNALRILTFLNRDIRLSNLDRKDLILVRYWLDLAGDILTENLNEYSYDKRLGFFMLEPFLVAMNHAATILETSQGRGGWLRSELNTLISKNINRTDEPPKKSLFTGKTKMEGGN